MFERKWIKIMGLAMSLPSTIFIMGWLTMDLRRRGILTSTTALLIFLGVVCNILFLMVYYAYKKIRN